MADKTVCIHIGARAHYLFPKALQRNNRLRILITDTWFSSSLLRSRLRSSSLFILKSLAGRFTPDIPTAKVKSFGLSFLLAEILVRLKHKDLWEEILARNDLFETKAATILQRTANYDSVLGISYTAKQCFRVSRQQGKRNVLFQIDPAIEEEIIVNKTIELYKNQYPTNWQKAPDKYWVQWKEECELSDVIIVNSGWSRDAIVKHGIDAGKIKVIPLPIDITPVQEEFIRKYPTGFSKDRPLCCLFLGTLTLRKGIHIVLETAKETKDLPIEFILVGNSELNIDFTAYPNVTYKGVVSRNETDTYYREADVFLFPTLSDGFGLTQLEAMSWKLPVIASAFCGEVVEHLANGFVLPANTPGELFSVLHLCLEKPALLQQLSSKCFQTAKDNNIGVFSKKLATCF